LEILYSSERILKIG